MGHLLGSFALLNIAVNQSSAHTNTLIWAIVCSILLHGFLALVIPNLKFDIAIAPDILQVELVKKPEPPPADIPEPIQSPTEVIKPKIKPPPTKPKVIPIPEPMFTPTPVPVKKNELITEASPVTHQTEVMAVSPQPNAKPATNTVPTVVLVKPEPQILTPSQNDIDGAKEQYGKSLWSAINKQKVQKKLADIRQLYGTSVVELQLDGNGRLQSKKIIESSGHAMRDSQALEMVEKAAPYPTPPEVLRGSNFSITVPISFVPPK